MTKAILFDLDNTLILFDESKFFKAYIQKAAPVMSDIVPAHTLWKMVLGATKAVLNNNGIHTNKEVFYHTFNKKIEHQTEEIWNRFQKFYENEFDQLKSLVRVNEGVSEIFSQLAPKKIKIVIASNPFWPCIAMEKRMQWAGLDKRQVHFITHLENMHFCKPRLEYYQEICDQINEKPENCLMVGNDRINDMVAGKLGINTFLITDGLKSKNQLLKISQKIRFSLKKSQTNPDYSGSLLQLHQMLPALI